MPLKNESDPGNQVPYYENKYTYILKEKAVSCYFVNYIQSMSVFGILTVN